MVDTTYYVFEVAHPLLKADTLEVEAASFVDAVLWMAREYPGIHVKRLKYQYNMQSAGHA